MIDEQLLNDCKTGSAINEENCMTIVRDNSRMAFGRRYGFEKIKSADDFRASVPLTDNKDYRGYIDAMRGGEKDVLTSYEVFAYCRTSGTSGGKKIIPASREEFRRYSNYFERYQDSVIKKYGGKRLYLNFFRTVPFGPEDEPLLMSEIYYRNLAEQGYIDFGEYIGGEKLMFGERAVDVCFAKVWLAVLHPDITALESVYLYDQLYFFNYFERNWREVIDCIRDKRVPDHIDLPENIKEYLLSTGYDEKRLETVERECAKGFDNIAGRLWKGLRLMSGISNKAFFAEDDSLRGYAPDVPRYYLCYASSECHIGHPVGEDDFGYVLMPRHAFYEFLPYDTGSGKTLLPHELEVGKRYEVVCTNFAGLYRYCMGDIVEIRGFCGECPIMEFVCRKNQILSVAGEKTDIMQIEEAVAELASRGIAVEQYCFSVSMERIPARYLAAVSCEAGYDSGTIAEELDRILQEKNCDYKDLRSLHSLDPLEAVVLGREEYVRFLGENGLISGHNKPKHIAVRGFSERSFYKWRDR